MFLHADTEDSDQTARMRRLIYLSFRWSYVSEGTFPDVKNLNYS